MLRILFDKQKKCWNVEYQISCLLSFQTKTKLKISFAKSWSMSVITYRMVKEMKIVDRHLHICIFNVKSILLHNICLSVLDTTLCTFSVPFSHQMYVSEFENLIWLTIRVSFNLLLYIQNIINNLWLNAYRKSYTWAGYFGFRSLYWYLMNIDWFNF